MVEAGDAFLHLVFQAEQVAEKRRSQVQLALDKLKFITWKLRHDPTTLTWANNPQWKSLRGALETHRRVEALCPKIVADVLKADNKKGRPRWDIFYEHNPDGVLVEIWVKALGQSNP